MDFDAIASTIKDSTTLEIIHPTTGEGGWFIELATPGNAKAQNAARAVLDKSEKNKSASRVEKDRFNAEFLASMVLGWSGLTREGQEVPYSHKDCVALFLNPKAFWVTNQISRALGDPTRPFDVS